MSQKEYKKAVEWVCIVNLYQVAELNFIGTLGEACYFAGDLNMAKHYGNLLSQLDNKRFPDALNNWMKNKEGQ
jgi:hypothetical protein